ARLRSVDARSLQRRAQLTGRAARIDAEALDGVAPEARGEERVMLGGLSLLRQTLLREGVEFAQRPLHRRETLLRRDLDTPPEQHPEDESRECREGDHGRDGERDATEFGGERLGQLELRLQWLDVRGVLTVPDHGRDVKHERRGHGNARHTVRPAVWDLDRRNGQIADDPRRYSIPEGPPCDPGRTRRTSRRQALKHLEVADGVRDRRIADLVPRLGIRVQRQERRIADSDGRAIERRGRVDRIRAGSDSRDGELQRQDQRDHEPLHVRRVRALNSAISAGTNGRSVYRSMLSMFMRASDWRRSVRRRRAVLAYSSRSLRSLVSMCAILPVSASSSATTPTLGSSSSRESLSTSAMTSCFRPSMRTAGSSTRPTSRKSDTRKTTLRFFVMLMRNRAASVISVRTRRGGAKRSSRITCSRCSRPRRDGIHSCSPSAKRRSPTRSWLRIAVIASSAATSAARSRLLWSTDPNQDDAEMSTARRMFSSRSSRNFLMYGVPMRAVTFQSMLRISSPGSYSRTSSNSSPDPRNTLR